MKKGWMVWCLGFVFSLAAGTLSAQQAASARQVVESSTDSLLLQIVEHRDLYKQDTQKFYDDIDGLLTPVVDFERIARRVMAKYYRSASEDQRERFVNVFKQSLMNVYAKGLLDFDNEKVEVLNSRAGSTDPEKDQVDIIVVSKNGNEFPISYSMFLDDDGQWKMENVIVNGINIGLTYRNQFARLMQVNSNDIDKVIDSWTSEVKTSQG